MTRPHILFPDNRPPAFQNGCGIDDGILWLLAVMDPDNGSRRFVASVYVHLLTYGEISSRQLASIQKILQRVNAQYHEKSLRCQGYEAAPADSVLCVGDIIEFPRAASNCEALIHDE